MIITDGSEAAIAVSADRPPARAWAHRLRSGAGRLVADFAPLEQVFLITGERLRTLHGKVADLRETTAAAGAVLDSVAFREMLDDLATARSGIDGLREGRGLLVPALESLVATADLMLGALSRLSGIMVQVRVLGVNAKIEAAQLANAETDFSVFTSEIGRLAHASEQTIAAVRGELTAMRTTAAHALTLRGAFERQDLPELDGVADRLARSLRGVAELRDRAAAGSSPLATRLKTLFAHISDLVGNLQVYDMTRQRLEHIDQALTLAAAMIEQDNAFTAEDRRLSVFVNGIAELQGIQLSQADAGYHAAIADVGRALVDLAGGITAIADLCDQSFGSAGGQSLAEIDRDIRAAGAAFGRFVAVREEVTACLDEVIAATQRTGRLVTALQAVSTDLRLMGLNASIKCGRVGTRGRALNVVAQQLQAYATQTRTLVTSTAENLARVTAATDQMQQTVNADRRAGVADLTLALDGAARRLGLTGAEVTSLLGEIAAIAKTVVDLTRATADGFGGNADYRAVMVEALRTLKAIAAETDSGLHGAALEAARREVLAFSEAHYTMASERIAHGAALGTKSLTAVLTGETGTRPAAAPAVDEEPDISGLLF